MNSGRAPDAGWRRPGGRSMVSRVIPLTAEPRVAREPARAWTEGRRTSGPGAACPNLIHGLPPLPAHLPDQALGPHISPLPFDKIKAGLAGAFAVHYRPAGRHIREGWPQ